jgi:hypothetical protein
VPASMNSHASKIHVAGDDRRVAGANLKWFGSILHNRKSTQEKLRLPWLHEWQQRHHLS